MSVFSMVSARIPPERTPELIARFGAAVRAGMPERRQTTLLRGDGERWSIITFWRSRQDFDNYLASVDEPFATRLFHDAGGGTPEVNVFEVVLDSNAKFWP
ncbi:MAG TPA: antibiotic biosynthesis monooxygenase [Pseudonocardiaceae bacterium]